METETITTIEDAITDIYSRGNTSDANDKYHSVEILLTVCNDGEVSRCLSHTGLWREVVLPSHTLALIHDNIGEMDAYELIQVYEAFRKSGQLSCQSYVDELFVEILINQQPLLSIERPQISSICKDILLYDFLHNLNGRSVWSELSKELGKRGIIAPDLNEERLCNHFLIPIRKVIGKLYEECDREDKYSITHLFFIYQGLFKKEHTESQICDAYHGLRCNNYCRNAAKIRFANNLNFCSNDCIDAYNTISNI